MEIQEFGQDNTFGITNTENIDESMLKDLFLNGGSPTADIKDIKDIVEDEDEDVKPSKKTGKQKDKVFDKVSDDTLENQLKNSFLGDDDDDEEDDEDAKSKSPFAPKAKQPKQEVKQPEAQTEEEESYDSPFTEIHKELLNLGIFTTDENEEETQITTPEEFQERWEREGQKKAMNTIYDFLESRHGEEGIKVFEDIFQRGVSPQQYLQQYVQLQSVQNLDMTNEADQERALRTYYEQQGLDKPIIDKKIQKHKDYSDMDEEAPIAHQWLIKNEEKRMQHIVEEQEQRERAKAQYQQHYHSTLSQILNNAIKEKQINGYPVTDKVAREVFDFVYTPKYTLNNEDLTDFDRSILELRKPENYKLKVLLGLILKNKGDLSKVKTQAISEETNKFFNKFVQKDKNQKRTQTQPTNSTFGLDL